MTTEINYDDYKLMIYRAAWNFHARTGLDWDDLCAQGNLIYCQSLQRYNPEKGKFSTFLRSSLYQYLMNYVQIPYQQEMHQEVNDSFQSEAPDPMREAAFKEAVDHLSEAAKVMVSLVWGIPEALSEICKTTKADGTSYYLMSKERIYSYLREYEGWTYTKCWKAADEIKAALAAI